MSHFDIIVVGAGPAGSAAATWAAKQGLRVALLDKATFPRSKLCGGLFTERSRAYFKEIFGRDVDLSKAVTRRDIVFCHAGEPLATLHDVPPLHLTMRLDLDAQMFGHALAAGAADFTGRAITEVTDKHVKFRDGQTISSAILIGADGVNSIVARHLFGTSFDVKKIGFGLEVEVPATFQDPEKQPLRIDFAAARWGYGWSFPKQHSTTVGVGGIRAQNDNMKAQLHAYFDDLNLPTENVRLKGHHLPFGDFRQTPGRAHMLLAGDAAGLVDPITGEGIAYAIKSGQRAAQAACDALSAGDPASATARYKTALIDIHRNLRIARGLRNILFAPRLHTSLLATFRRSGTVRVMYMRLLAGEVEYPQLALNVVTRLPRYVAQAFKRRS